MMKLRRRSIGDDGTADLAKDAKILDIEDCDGVPVLVVEEPVDSTEYIRQQFAVYKDGDIVSGHFVARLGDRYVYVLRK